MIKKILGLDIGSNSIGFSLLKLSEQSSEVVFDELVSNSIIFSEPNDASDRREARSSRRRNERRSARNKYARKVFVEFNIAKKDFIDDTTYYLNTLNIGDKDVYNIREKAVSSTNLTKDEFILSTYSILTNRGYNNMFSISKEDGLINEPVSKNKEQYLSKNHPLPSMVLTSQRKELEETYQNIPIRNKKEDYHNSLGRDMHMEEFKKLVSSQIDNKEIFNSQKDCEKFIEQITDENIINAPFYQRDLKSFESMVEYCTFYNKYNIKAKEKRIPLSNIKNIELTLLQKIDNYECIDTKTGEIKILSNDEIKSIINYWINTPSSNEINGKNIFNSLGKNFKLSIPEKTSQIVLNIQAYRKISEILNNYDIKYIDEDNSFYNDILLVLYYFKNHGSRVEHIANKIKEYNLNLSDDFIEEIALLDGMDGFGSFSLRFINEVLELINQENKSFHEALEALGYFSKYLDMPVFDYLPPLEPTSSDIKWLERNIPYFKTQYLFYQPMVSPKVKRVISILRKLINELIKKYGKIDEIRIETAREMNSSKEQDKIKENQSKDKRKNDEAIKFLKANDIKESNKNILRAKLFIEQGKNACRCLYSGKIITLYEAFDENETEIEHFIPRSVIWINSYKNKILIKKETNQNKTNLHPIKYLKSIGQWEDFKGRVQESFMAFNKKDWLSKEEIINSVMQKEHWKDSFLNDTRTATKTIAKYLNHYLYPSEKEHNKDGNRHIFSVSGKAINELKYIWGISDIMPKNKDDKKDRDTNYHHTLDAFAVALCSSGAINILHNHFIKKENKFKTKALKDKLTSNIPVSNDGINIVEYLKNLVQKYESNKLYVCPYNKRKVNMKGFKDGNLKLYVAKDSKDDTKEILAEIEKVAIDNSLLIKVVNGFPKPRSDAEVNKEIKSIQNRLNPQKQKNIIKAVDVYAKELLDLRTRINILDKEIKNIKNTLKTGKQHKEYNDNINESLKPQIEQKDNLSKQMQELKCSFPIKNGKRQIVKSLKLYKTKIEQSKADAIIFPHRKENKIERLSISNFKQALEDKEPFVTKMNESTLNVQLYSTEKRGQVVGLNYFSSIANSFETKINDRYRDEKLDKDNARTLYKNDLIKVTNTKELKDEYFIFNGGGNIAGTNNKISIKNINKNSFEKIDRKGGLKYIKEDNISPGKLIIVSKVNIDFFGNISEV